MLALVQPKMFYQMYDQLFTVLEHRDEIAGRF